MGGDLRSRKSFHPPRPIVSWYVRNYRPDFTPNIIVQIIHRRDLWGDFLHKFRVLFC
jgi:hypothetical protein